MKHLLTTTCVILTSILAFAQSLPMEFHFSDNGQRLFRGAKESTGFYNESNIDTIYLEFDQSDYWDQLIDNYEDKIDIAATMTMNGITYDSVGVRFKGQTSYLNTTGQGGPGPGGGGVYSDKKSFNISLDYVFDQDIEGYETLNLNNAMDDAAFVREVTFNHLCREHISSPKANWSVLYLNGENWGLYVNVQQLDKKHAGEWYLDEDCTRWRAEDPNATFGPGGGNPFGTGTSTLNYLGSDTTDYQSAYTLKNAYKPYPWDDLAVVCDILNNTPTNLLVDSLDRYFDIDGALWQVANEIAYSDDDSYVHKGGMDYYVYFDEYTGRLAMQEYDGNSALVLNHVNWDPFYNETDTRFPILNILLSIPELRQRYLAHMRTILENQMNPAISHVLVDNYAGFIDEQVNNDPKKLYTYNEFLTDVQDVKSYFTQRYNFLWSDNEVNVQGLTIENVEYSVGGIIGQQPTNADVVDITADISGPMGISSILLHYGNGLMGLFNQVEMFDDGNHNDGIAGDGTFGAAIPAYQASEYVRFYIEAIGNNIAETRSYMPQGAEHDVYIYRVKFADYAASSDVVINEIMASNNSTIADEYGEFDDWIELYNTSSSDIDLTGFHLTDEATNLIKWSIPSGTIIGANDYLIIWADNDIAQLDLHANFKLSAAGEEVFLMDAVGEIADEVSYTAYTSDKGFARVPNGTGDFIWQHPTFSVNNEAEPLSIISRWTGDLSINVYPNPTTGCFNVKTDHNQSNDLCIYDSVGNIVYKEKFQSYTEVSTSDWAKGVYHVRVGGNTCQLVVL